MSTALVRLTRRREPFKCARQFATRHCFNLCFRFSDFCISTLLPTFYGYDLFSESSPFSQILNLSISIIPGRLAAFACRLFALLSSLLTLLPFCSQLIFTVLANLLALLAAFSTTLLSTLSSLTDSLF